MRIKSSLKTYDVITEKDPAFLTELTEKENTFFVISKTVYDLYQPLFSHIAEDNLYLLSSTEENKTIYTALEICEKISSMSSKRNTTLISVGGGVIQDITGFVANIMYRGIHWIFVPSTLLSACDSCIGGKTSLNFKRYKNLLGTFYPPDEIHIWPGIFQTLAVKDYLSGLGEVVKFNIMTGEKGLDNMEENLGFLLKRDQKTVDRFVQKSLEYKKQFIEIDEFDRGERIKLNFAHTFGHAIEVVSEYAIPHGTAVAIGMIMANYVSHERGYLAENTKKRIENVLRKIIDINIDVLDRPIEDYLAAIRKDKKQVGDSITAVLITAFGEQSELTVVHDVMREEIEGAIRYFIGFYGAKQ